MSTDAVELERPQDLGAHRTCFELNTDPIDAESAIAEFLDYVRRLPSVALEQWTRATMKTFSIGVQAGFDPYVVTSSVSAEVLGAIAAHGATIELIVYAPVAVGTNPEEAEDG